MKEFRFDFCGKNNVQDVLGILYGALNSIVGSNAIIIGVKEKIVWNAHMDYQKEELPNHGVISSYEVEDR